jgi:hypothetical protein
MMLCFRPRIFLSGLIAATLVGGSHGLAQDLFPQVSPPLVVPDAAPERTSPFTGALNNLFSNQWVQTNGDGALRGSVVTLAGEDTLSVSGTTVVLAQRGRIIASTSSNQDGEFFFGNVPPGFYSIVAEADNSFATFALAVLSKDMGAHLPNSVELRVIRPKGDSIRRIFGVEVMPKVSTTDNGDMSDPISTKRTYAKSHRILSSEDGKVVGRLSTMGMAPEIVDMSQMKAILLKDGSEIARSDVSVDGYYRFDNVQPGCYGLAAAGNRGVAAVAFCVLKPESMAMKRTSDGKFFVAAAGALQDTASPSLNVELADGADVMVVEDEVTPPEDELVEEEPFMPFPPMGGQAGAGQIIGGGGSGGIGAGLGELAGLGALGAIAAILADELGDDDDVNNNVVSPVSN